VILNMKLELSNSIFCDLTQSNFILIIYFCLFNLLCQFSDLGIINQPLILF
jgi:hypothetical protein